MILKCGMIALLALTLAGCLKTRSEVGENEQSQVYGKKNADNQRSAETSSNISSANSQANAIDGASVQSSPPIDDRDELIRTLNGRVEGLESQIESLNKDKAAKTAEEAGRLQALQEALTKMDAQIQKLEAEQAAKEAAKNRVETVTRPSGARVQGSDKNEAIAKPNATLGTYEVAQGHFAQKEWKKAIFNYQKYTDESPKGKNIADAKYKIGVCFQELGMKEEAMAFYEEVIANYSKTEAGKKAKMRLKKLKI